MTTITQAPRCRDHNLSAPGTGEDDDTESRNGYCQRLYYHDEAGFDSLVVAIEQGIGDVGISINSAHEVTPQQARKIAAGFLRAAHDMEALVAIR